MNRILSRVLFATVLSLGAHAALADDSVRDTRTVAAGISKVQLGGVIHLVVRQGATPSLVLSGERRYVARITTATHGDTLVIDMEPNTHIDGNTGDLRAELTVPSLQELVSEGVGAADVTGFKGDRLKLSLDGAGAMRVAGQYRDVDANLGGVGSMTLNPGQAERVVLHLGGAGHLVVAGQTKVLRVDSGGIGSVDAQKLVADRVDLDMAGMGGASVYARTAANVNLSGMGSATVFGKPATRNATTNGFGKVSWK